eukprot:m.13729 g.13729  ORF g.13729 m.13729 type:complete len:354 (+) comp10195_c0_seq1:59-1120(+)
MITTTTSRNLRSGVLLQQQFLVVVASVAILSASQELPASAVISLRDGETPPLPNETFRVGVVQMCNFDDGYLRNVTQEIRDKTEKVVKYIHRAANLGAEIAVFPEMVLVRYDAALIARGTAADVAVAESEIAAACKSAKIWAIVGMPKYMRPGEPVTEAICNDNATWWNTALVFDATGSKVYRQAKLRCGGPDGQLGKWLDTFQGPRNITSSLQICADAGDPNIARLPALRGAQLIYDISAESGLNAFPKLAPYEAQYMARAHESRSYLVQANMGSTFGPKGVYNAQGGSHGNSLIVAPDGNVLIKAPVLGEHLVLQDLDLRMLQKQPGYLPHVFMQKFYDTGVALLTSMPID